MFGSKAAKLGVAAAAGAGTLLNPEEAEAGRIFVGKKAARQFAKRLLGDSTAPNILREFLTKAHPKTGMTKKEHLRATEEAIAKMRRNMDQMSEGKRGFVERESERLIAGHVHNYYDYDDWSKAMKKAEKGPNGAGYLTGVDIMYEELAEEMSPQFLAKHQQVLDGYADYRIGPDQRGRPARGRDNRGRQLRDKAYYEKLHNRPEFRHTATQEPKKSAQEVMRLADEENAARRATDQAKAEEANRVAEEAKAIRATEGEPGKARTGRAAVDRKNLKRGLLGGGGAGGAGGAGAADVYFTDDTLLDPAFPESPSSVGFGPTAEQKVQMEFDGAHDTWRGDQAQIAAPRSDTLQQITMGARGIQRNLEGSPGALLFPDGLVNYLEAVNRPNEDPTWATRAWGLLDFL